MDQKRLVASMDMDIAMSMETNNEFIFIPIQSVIT